MATERYEELRGVALGVSTSAPASHGLVLLMRSGMAAWMRAWASCAAPRALAPTDRAPLPPAPPELVAVLAEMALAAADKEVSA